MNAKIRASPPDLVLLDLMLPEMNGLEVCRRLRQNPVTQGIPIVMLTARRDVIDRLEKLRAGALREPERIARGHDLLGIPNGIGAVGYTESDIDKIAGIVEATLHTTPEGMTR